MQDQLILFKTAKLAKEKKFDWKCKYLYKSNKGWEEGIGEDYNWNIFDTYSAPTQSLLQKWLREEHNINVESNYLPNIEKFRCIFKPMNIKPNQFNTNLKYIIKVNKYYGKTNHNTYEEALEEGLQKALKLIE